MAKAAQDEAEEIHRKIEELPQLEQTVKSLTTRKGNIEVNLLEVQQELLESFTEEQRQEHDSGFCIR